RVVVGDGGGATFGQNRGALAVDGRLVVYGAATGPSGAIDLGNLFGKQFEVVGTTMASRSEFETVMKLVFRGAYEPVIDVVLPLDRAREAHERLERGEQFGKIVLVP